MKIAIITWPINDVGGINSWCENAIIGLRRLGHDVQLFHSTAQKKFGCDPKEKIHKARFSLLPGLHLSYHGSSASKSLELINGYDLIIFLHASPHPTRKLEELENGEDWKLFYQQTTPRKLVILHDENWEKTNSWFADVADHVDGLMAGQHRFYASALRYPSKCKKWYDIQPLDLVEMEKLHVPFSAKQLCGTLATQWLKWKNHGKFLPQLPNIKVPIHAFGSGQEYYELKADGPFDEVFNYDQYENSPLNPNSIHIYVGFIPYQQLQARVAQSLFSIDLSTKGYMNMTHIEPIALKTLSLVERRIYESETNHIPQDCCVAFDLEDAAQRINRLAESDLIAGHKATLERGWKFIQQASCEQVMSRMLKQMETI